MSKPTIEITANIGTAERPNIKSMRRTEPISQRVLAGYLQVTTEELGNVAKLFNIPRRLDDSVSGKPAVFYDIRQVLPILRGLKEISGDRLEWLGRVDLTIDEVVIEFPGGSKIKYFED